MSVMRFSKILLMGALSMGLIVSVASCVGSKVDYLYVTGTAAQTSDNGIITGYKIDLSTGGLTPIGGLPISSGGTNPVRAVLTSGGRFIYVLNRGMNSAGNADCTTANPCENANISEFTVSADGRLTPQKVYYSQGSNPFRMILDTSGNYLLVLDHDAPDNYEATYNPSTNACTLALGSGVQTCGDITVFQIDSTTGDLSLVNNAHLSSAAGGQLSYFPIPANPVDFVMSSGFVLTLTSETSGDSFPYSGGTAVWPYAYASNSGQLTLSQKSVQPLNIANGTAMENINGLIYVLDNQSISTTVGGEPYSAASQFETYSVGTNGSLEAESSGVMPDDSTLSNPIQLLLDNSGHWLYVANQGNNATGVNVQSGIAAYNIFTSPSYQLNFIPGQPFSSGAGPQCIVEDPSKPYVYTANYNSSDVTGYVMDQNSGMLQPLQRVATQYPLQGPATWCLVDGHLG